MSFLHIYIFYIHAYLFNPSTPYFCTPIRYSHLLISSYSVTILISFSNSSNLISPSSPFLLYPHLASSLSDFHISNFPYLASSHSAFLFPFSPNFSLFLFLLSSFSLFLLFACFLCIFSFFSFLRLLNCSSFFSFLYFSSDLSIPLSSSSSPFCRFSLFFLLFFPQLFISFFFSFTPDTS